MSANRSRASCPRLRVQMLPVDRLVPTPDNKRRRFERVSLESLGRSITQQGVLQPLIVRVHPSMDGHWEIRAGERRWRAAKLAGLKEVPAIVKKLDDESAYAVTIVENLQRENLHPIEEAEGIQDALNRGFSLKSIAAKLGKPVRYVARRASLSSLTEVWKEAAFKSESDVGRLSAAHLELIARLPASTQDALARDGFRQVFARGFPTVEELRSLIDPELRLLKSMAWDPTDETLVPEVGSCTSCPKRSGMHPLLFDAADSSSNGKVSKTDRCLDPACFARKHEAFIVRSEAEAKKSFPDVRLVQVTFDRPPLPYPDNGDGIRERVSRVYSPRFVSKGTKGAIPVMAVDGPKAGKISFIEGAEVSSGHVPKRAKGTPLSMDERRSRLGRRRDAVVVDTVAERLRSLPAADLARTTERLAGTDAGRAEMLSMVLAFGTSSRADREHTTEAWERAEQLKGSSDRERVSACLTDLVSVWSRRLHDSNPRTISDRAADARRMCVLFGWDAAALDAEAVQKIPTPKHWPPEAVEAPPFETTEPQRVKRSSKSRSGRKRFGKRTRR